MNNQKCIFCDIVSGKAPAYKIMEDELSMVILDIHPYAKGHCLVIPKRHVQWWHEMTEDETVSLFKLAHRAANKIMKTIEPDFMCLYARGKRIPHTHIFLIPTVEGDVLDRFYGAMEKFQEAPQELTKLKDSKSMMEAAKILRE